MDVALATCARLPEPDHDEAPLLAALKDEGLDARSLAWDDPGASFGDARATILRATWNYHRQPERFLAWAEATARSGVLWNPLATVRWNIHKRYLLDLARAGIDVVPTELVTRGSEETLAGIRARRSFGDVVIKPAISAASRDTLKVGAEDLDAGEAHLAALLEREDVLVQPYLHSVEGYGERALVWIDGEVTHAVRKTPRFLGDDESVASVPSISAEERSLAGRAVAAAPGDLLYARIDVAPGPDGTPLVVELELLEPSLFFPHSDPAVRRLAAAIRRRLRSSG